MKRKIYIDVESAGLKGALHTIQYSIDRGPVKVIWLSQRLDPHRNSTFRRCLVEFLSVLTDSDTIAVGYNIKFDLWKLYQHFRPDEPWKLEVVDLYTHTLKSKPLCYYPLVGGKSVIILRRLPERYLKSITTKISEVMQKVLPPIAKITITTNKEKIEPGETQTYGLKFGVKLPAKLKVLAQLFLSPSERAEIIQFSDVMKTPNDFGWKEDMRFPYIMPGEEEKYQEVWDYNEKILRSPEGVRAFEYMVKDIEYLWKLEDWLIKEGNTIEPDDDDVCNHAVAWTQFFGFPVDVKKGVELCEKFTQELKGMEDELGIDLESPAQRLELLKKHAVIPEMIVSTSAKNLKILLMNKDAGVLTSEGYEIAEKMAQYKPMAQRRKQLEVITGAIDGRAYPDFVVLGTSTHRMRGTGGLNYQGISKDGEIRELFYTSMGGDFDGLEWTLAANIFNDKEMLAGLSNGIDPHLLASYLLRDLDGPFGSMTYDEMVGIKNDPDHSLNKAIKKDRSEKKTVNFGVLYLAGAFKISQVLGCTPEEAETKMEENYFRHYASLGENRRQLIEKFCTADFEYWTKNSVGKMEDHVVSISGDVRWICFEKYIATWLWENSQELSQLVSKEDSEKVMVRRLAKGKQTWPNAIRSSVLGAASGIQKSVMRQLGNFPIQNAGARLTKKLMAEIWRKHRVAMMNVHDEIDLPADINVSFPSVKTTVDNFIRREAEKIKHLSMEWKPIKTWAEK